MSGTLLPVGPLQAFIADLNSHGETYREIAERVSSMFGRPMPERQMHAIAHERRWVTLDTADRILLAHGRYVGEFYELDGSAVK
jgi:hypothetical protein